MLAPAYSRLLVVVDDTIGSKIGHARILHKREGVNGGRGAGLTRGEAFARAHSEPHFCSLLPVPGSNFLPECIDKHPVAGSPLARKDVLLVDYFEIARGKLCHGGKFGGFFPAERPAGKAIEKPHVKRHDTLRLQVVELELDIETAQCSAVQCTHEIRGADQDSPEGFHAGVEGADVEYAADMGLGLRATGQNALGYRR